MSRKPPLLALPLQQRAVASPHVPCFLTTGTRPSPEVNFLILITSFVGFGSGLCRCRTAVFIPGTVQYLARNIIGGKRHRDTEPVHRNKL